VEGEVAYHSRFGGLWIDRHDAGAVLDRKRASNELTDVDAARLRTFMERGYVVIKQAVPHAVIDRYLEDLDRIWRTSDARFRVAVRHADTISPAPELRYHPSYRLVDVYAYSRAAREAMFAEPVVRFLGQIFERDVLAFQSLTFDRGSEQGIHQDPIFVVVSSPLELAASWIALEDIQEGSGELTYYEGSHRLPEFYFAGEHKHWNPQRDGDEAYAQYNTALAENTRRLALPLRKLSARKGDVLIWHADLAHGGSPITHPDPGITRRSLVTHYCPADVAPHFFTIAPERQTAIEWRKHCLYCSWHYPLAAIAETEPVPALALPRLLRRVKPLVPPPLWRLARRYLVGDSR
jgi:ectoine hydroxylase-related dioxygenase (phytanoyl-CoA dioxygenase family)